MTRDLLNLTLAAFLACGMIAVGVFSLRKNDRQPVKKELRQAAYILSVGEIASGVIGLVGCALFYHFWLR